jgi:hypothetical protein
VSMIICVVLEVCAADPWPLPSTSAVGGGT